MLDGVLCLTEIDGQRQHHLKVESGLSILENQHQILHCVQDDKITTPDSPLAMLGMLRDRFA
jgi:hypothetical protein